MRISAKDEYACLAVLDLALNYNPDLPVRVQDIAGRQRIPPKFLFQIMKALKPDVVRSKLGPDGGYILARPPEQITVGDVIKKLNSKKDTFVDFSRLESADSGKGALAEAADQFRPIWTDLDQAIGSVLNNVTFADLARKVRSRERQVMYHI